MFELTSLSIFAEPSLTEIITKFRFIIFRGMNFLSYFKFAVSKCTLNYFYELPNPCMDKYQLVTNIGTSKFDLDEYLSFVFNFIISSVIRTFPDGGCSISLFFQDWFN